MFSDIPEKLYFRIGEVAEITGVKSHVLRYWESEFASIRPSKSHGQQRLYRREDIELILYLKDLLYRQGFTIAGAKKKLRERNTGDQPPQVGQPFDAAIDSAFLAEIKADLQILRKSLDNVSSG